VFKQYSVYGASRLKKKSKLKFIVIIPLLFIFFIGINKIRYNYNWSDTFWRTLMTPFTGTIWSKGFSENNFLKIKIGMQKSEVDKLIGDPLLYSCESKGCSAYYSRQDTPTADYDRRWIEFDSSGKVFKVIKKFYID